MVTNHGNDQAYGRGISMPIPKNLSPRKSYAIVTPLNQFNVIEDGSNGDNAVVIVRGGAVVTTFYRRSNQPMTPDRLRVDEVIWQ